MPFYTNADGVIKELKTLDSYSNGTCKHPLAYFVNENNINRKISFSEDYIDHILISISEIVIYPNYYLDEDYGILSDEDLICDDDALAKDYVTLNMLDNVIEMSIKKSKYLIWCCAEIYIVFKDECSLNIENVIYVNNDHVYKIEELLEYEIIKSLEISTKNTITLNTDGRYGATIYGSKLYPSTAYSNGNNYSKSSTVDINLNTKFSDYYPFEMLIASDTNGKNTNKLEFTGAKINDINIPVKVNIEL